MATATSSAGAAIVGTRHYGTLDGLRGVAAIAVVGYHIDDFLGFRPESAYLAVDLFFVLSGFVLAHAYDRELGSRLSAASFFQKRVIRLFPLYLAGSAITAAAAAVAVFVSHDAHRWTANELLIAVLAASIMMPSFVNANIFPLNTPSWSLFFEFLANVAYGGRLWQGRCLVWAVPAGAAIGLLAEVTACGSVDRGAIWGDPWWTTFVWGGARVAYSFPVGLLLYRYHTAIRLPPLPVAILAFVLAALLCASPSGTSRAIFDLTFVLIVSPVIVVLGCQSEPSSRRQAALCAFLGSISYPIYALHQPITNIASGAVRRLAHGPIKPGWQPWIGIVLIAVLIMVAAVADRADRHIRRNWLTRQALPGAGVLVP
ncbi:MAG TPA: acyltransferase [Acetobacteraceae bacterium]|nr:acyltransferase [Acetobacteraceae bacterium]